jgi:hypothetical protein
VIEHADVPETRHRGVADQRVEWGVGLDPEVRLIDVA